MQRSDELFDVVDERDRVTGQATRADVHARGLRHRAVHVWLFNLRGELYVQKRSATKDTFPGCYDSSASGHLDSGEDYDACAARELREELGVDIPATSLHRIFKVDACAETGWEFVWLYESRGDYNPQPNSAEIESGSFVSRTELEELMTKHPERCARSFIHLIRAAQKTGRVLF